MTAKPI